MNSNRQRYIVNPDLVSVSLDLDLLSVAVVVLSVYLALVAVVLVLVAVDPVRDRVLQDSRSGKGTVLHISPLFSPRLQNNTKAPER